MTQQVATVNPEFKRMNEVSRGALLFQIKCQRCHSNSDKDDYRRGPNLWGVMGRQAGTQGYKKYSEQLKKSGIFWTRKTLKQYMNEPRKFVPGTLMFYGASLPADMQSDAIVTYLESLSPGYEQKYREIFKKQKDELKNEQTIKSLGGHPEVPLFGNENE